MCSISCSRPLGISNLRRAALDPTPVEVGRQTADGFRLGFRLLASRFRLPASGFDSGIRYLKNSRKTEQFVPFDGFTAERTEEESGCQPGHADAVATMTERKQVA